MIFFDTETTGLPITGETDPAKQPRIIEIAVVSIDWSTKLTRAFSSLIYPQGLLPAEIVKITGITDEMLKSEGRPFPAVLPELVDIWRSDPDNTLVAHNLNFDLDMLVFELRRIGWEHRFPYSRHQIDTVPLSGGKRLEKWAESLGVLKGPQTHRAMDDVQLLMACYERMEAEAYEEADA